MTPAFRSSRAPECVLPRAHRDASQRLQNYGPVRSMPGDKANWSDWTLRAVIVGGPTVAIAHAFGLHTILIALFS